MGLLMHRPWLEHRMTFWHPHARELSQVAGLLRATYRSNPSVLADRERSRRAVLYCCQDGAGRRSGALFGARVGALD